MLLGEWLNGRVAVSKTVGCVFESRLPCQTYLITVKNTVVRYFLYFLLQSNSKVEIAVSKTVRWGFESLRLCGTLAQLVRAPGS